MTEADYKENYLSSPRSTENTVACKGGKIITDEKYHLINDTEKKPNMHQHSVVERKR